MRPERAKLLHADRQTDGRTDGWTYGPYNMLIVAFLVFRKLLKFIVPSVFTLEKSSEGESPKEYS